jgi:hypothetical protein
MYYDETLKGIGRILDVDGELQSQIFVVLLLLLLPSKNFKLLYLHQKWEFGSGSWTRIWLCWLLEPML